MNKLISIITTFIIGAIIFYIIGIIISVILVVAFLIVNRIIVYYKKHKRFTDWEFKCTYIDCKWVNNVKVHERVEEFERYDRKLEIMEVRKNIIPISINANLGERYSLDIEWLNYELRVSSKR